MPAERRREVDGVHIIDILRYKGSSVATVTGTDALPTALAALADHGIGALVVTDGDAIVGIISERDIVRHLHTEGADVLSAQVQDVMTADVLTCAPTDEVDAVAQTMTEHRVRHMPVVADGRLSGIVSIGDVVLSRMRALEGDREQLERYITG
jgi:CBS domain-containing protein